MANDIDKLFRDQLHNRSFEWDEAYWEGAEAAIAAAEGRRRRRFFFFWISGATTVLMALGMWWILGQKSMPVTEQFPIEEKEVASKQHEAHAALPTEEPSIETRLESNRSGIVAPQAGIENTVEKKVDIAGETRKFHEVASSISLSTEKDVEVVLPVKEIHTPASVELQRSTEKAEILTENTLVFAALPGIPFYAMSEMTLEARTPGREENLPIEPASRTFSWRGGVGLGVQINGLPGDALPGLWAGGMLQGKLLDKWGWTAGLNYAVHQLKPEEIERTAQTLMSFGAAQTEYVSEARSAHRIVAPLGLIYRLNRRVQMEAGAIFSYRVTMRGVTKELSYPQPWERTSQEQSEYLPRLSSFYDDQNAGEDPEFPLLDRSSVFARGWLSANFEDAFQIQPFVGVQYNMGTRFTFTGKAAYPGTISVGAFYWLR